MRRINENDIEILVEIENSERTIDEITARVGFTRHASRVRLALVRLEDSGLAIWLANGRWRASLDARVLLRQTCTSLAPAKAC